MPSNSIKDSLSAARIGTYENVVGGPTGLLQTEKALKLYMWNAQISAAFFVPLHVCEVLTRNAISEVIETVYGDRWPWSIGFERSLPIPIHGYKPKDDLISGRRNQPTTGKVIPELKFVFWQKMLTGRFDIRLWNNHILTAFPHAVAQGLGANIRLSGCKTIRCCSRSLHLSRSNTVPGCRYLFRTSLNRRFPVAFHQST
ncbi:hypothetical protein [Pectobacterium versatile]|uniref:hypothetical protein n=1 Tax=Pectobacterium versatile TaxID=2488639 RepID=UPI0010F20798|nr:hypothetical protein [Pectobacterium versatile]TAI86528.1 hypothetical protein EG333_11240 [Pectobacterium versatile]